MTVSRLVLRRPAAWALVALAPAAAAQTPRIYDFTPPGAGNPVVAAVDGGWIQIPLSEFHGHLSAELGDDARRGLTLDGKRRQLERLVDEHLILRDAYRQQADRTERAAVMLQQTRKMLLGELLLAREVDARATCADEQDRLRRQLLDRAFERARIDVSNEAYAALQEAVNDLAPRATAEEPAGLAASLPQALRDRPLAAFEDTRVTVGDAVGVYFSLPARVRPTLDSRAGLEVLLEHLLEYELLAAEAVARGIDRTRTYLEKVERNRNAIVRMWWRDRLARRARERMAAPENESRIRAWYAAQAATRYAERGADGIDRILPFAGNEERIRSDYFDALCEELRTEEAQALRRGHHVVIDEAVLARD